ncbi:MAG: hypothetical protein WCO66_02260 [Candidatus Absconditabacteria bacterium]
MNININVPDFKNFNAKEKFNHIKTLFTGITAIVQKDSGILKPTYSLLFFSFFVTTLLFSGIILLIEKIPLGIGLIFLGLLMGVYKHFFFVKKDALQSTLVYQTIVNGKSDIYQAKEAYKAISGKMFFVGLADYFVRKGTQYGNKNNTIMRMLFSLIEEVWDLLKNFMIPVVVIENKSLKEAVEDLKILKGKIPETLVGVLGFDFAGKFLLGALFDIFIIVLLVMTGVSYGLPFVAHLTTFTVQGISFSVSAIMFSFYLMVLIENIVAVLAESVKTVYFTTFYMLIQHPDKINQEIAPKLVEFIEMKDPKEQVGVPSV